MGGGCATRTGAIAITVRVLLGLIYSRGRVDYVAITSSSGACDGASVGFQLLRAAS
jgi:hypothetical protein